MRQFMRRTTVLSQRAAVRASRRFLFLPQEERLLFAKRLAMTLRAELPITQGLILLCESVRSRGGAHIFREVFSDVNAGRPLSDSLRRFESQFGAYAIAVVQVGERAGSLAQSLDHLAEELRRRRALYRRVIGALAYPALVLGASCAIVILLTAVVFPKIMPVFAGVHTTLPLPTRVLMTVSGFLVRWHGYVLVGVVVFGMLATLSLRVGRVRRVVDVLVLHMPLIGLVLRAYHLANINRTLSALLRSDVPIPEALSLTAAATGNGAYRTALRSACAGVVRGETLARQFGALRHLFPVVCAQMIEVGERTGGLPAATAYLAESYEEEFDDRIRTLTTLLEPVLMLIVGAIVGFIALAIIMPIYALTQGVSLR